jgi:hypothetical protein
VEEQMTKSSIFDNNFYLDSLDALSTKYFGKSNFQTVVFLFLEIGFTMEGSPDYLPTEKAIRKYLSWQNRVSPKNAMMKKCGRYVFDHSNDLTWNDCLKFDTEYRLEVAKSYEPKLITFEELEEDEVYKESIEHNVYYTKVEGGYINDSN